MQHSPLNSSALTNPPTAVALTNISGAHAASSFRAPTIPSSTAVAGIRGNDVPTATTLQKVSAFGVESLVSKSAQSASAPLSVPPSSFPSMDSLRDLLEQLDSALLWCDSSFQNLSMNDFHRRFRMCLRITSSCERLWNNAKASVNIHMQEAVKKWAGGQQEEKKRSMLITPRRCALLTLIRNFWLTEKHLEILLAYRPVIDAPAATAVRLLEQINNPLDNSNLQRIEGFFANALAAAPQPMESLLVSVLSTAVADFGRETLLQSIRLRIIQKYSVEQRQYCQQSIHLRCLSGSTVAVLTDFCGLAAALRQHIMQLCGVTPLNKRKEKLNSFKDQLKAAALTDFHTLALLACACILPQLSIEGVQHHDHAENSTKTISTGGSALDAQDVLRQQVDSELHDIFLSVELRSYVALILPSSTCVDEKTSAAVDESDEPLLQMIRSPAWNVRLCLSSAVIAHEFIAELVQRIKCTAMNLSEQPQRQQDFIDEYSDSHKQFAHLSPALQRVLCHICQLLHCRSFHHCRAQLCFNSFSHIDPSPFMFADVSQLMFSAGMGLNVSDHTTLSMACKCTEAEIASVCCYPCGRLEKELKRIEELAKQIPLLAQTLDRCKLSNRGSGSIGTAANEQR